MELVTSVIFPHMTPPTQRTSRDPHNVKLLSLFVTQCMVTAGAILLSVLLLSVLVSRGRLRRDLFKQLVASLAAGGAIFSLLARPGAIHEDTSTSILTDGYCGFYLTILDVESIVVAYTTILLTVERIIAVSEPENYTKRFTTLSRTILLVSPWICGFMYGLTRTFGLTDGIIAHYGGFPDDPYYNKHSELAAGQCMLIFYKKNDNARLILGDLVATEIPILMLFITTIVLLILYCRRYRDGRVRSELDLDIPVVHRGSVVFVLILNCILIVALLSDFIFAEFVASWGSSHWKICVFEIIVAILGLTMLPDVRRALDRIFCCHDNADDRDTLIAVSPQRETASAIDEDGGIDYVQY